MTELGGSGFDLMCERLLATGRAIRVAREGTCLWHMIFGGTLCANIIRTLDLTEFTVEGGEGSPT